MSKACAQGFRQCERLGCVQDRTRVYVGKCEQYPVPDRCPSCLHACEKDEDGWVCTACGTPWESLDPPRVRLVQET